MEGNRVLAENFKKRKVRIILNNKLFDFAKNLRVGEKGILDVQGRISSEKKLDNDQIIKTFKITNARLIKNVRAG